MGVFTSLTREEVRNKILLALMNADDDLLCRLADAVDPQDGGYQIEDPNDYINEI